MGELLSGGEGQFRTQGMGAAGTATSVSEALDADLDAYLDRELFVGPRAEPVLREAQPGADASGSMRALLDMAEAEADWLETLPPPAAAPVEQKREPAEPPVVIPEWMRVDPATVAPTASAAETAAHVLRESAVAGLPWGSAAGTDVSGMPMTPWSVPAGDEGAVASAPTFPGNLLPGIPTPPPVASWAPPAVPMAPYPAQPWTHAMAAPVEPRRILGMRPGAFLGAAAVGALTAGLLVVAGMHFRDSVTGKPQLASTVSETGAIQPAATGALPDGTLGTAQSGLAGVPSGAIQPGATGSAADATQNGATGALMAGTTGSPQPGDTGFLPLGAAGTAQFGSTGALPPGVTGTAQFGRTGVLSDGTVSAAQPGATDTQTPAATAPGADMKQAVASGQDIQGVANGLRASQPAAPAASSTALTSGKAAPIATRTKAPAKPRATAPTVTEDTSTAEEESTEAPSSELTFNDAESTDTDGTESPGAKVAVSSEQARPPGKYAELDEDFARELGFTEDAESKAGEASGSKRTVYIPPAPDEKEHLTPDDVKQVVVTNQPAITACIRQHAKGTPVEGGGRFLVKWSVLPNGDTAQVSMDTDTLRATPLARCLEDVVRRWKFPAHRVRMAEPIRFPFVF